MKRRAKLRRSRAETSVETRAALIRAGVELFGAHRLDAPSLDRICEHAGKTRGAFYVHFADRDAFIAAVMETVGLPFLDVVLGTTGDGPRTLAAVVERFVVAVGSGEYPLTAAGGVRPHQLLDACARSEPIRARYAGLIAQTIHRLSGIVARDQRHGEVRVDMSASAITTILLAAVVGAQTMLELEVGVDFAVAAAALVQMLSVDRPK